MQATLRILIGVWVSGTRPNVGMDGDIQEAHHSDRRFQALWTRAFQIKVVRSAVIIGTFRYHGATQ